MKTYPAMFKDQMVRAIISGAKTQTRRLATSQLAKVKPGDLIWVRECCFIGPCVLYRADGAELQRGQKWTPSMLMPKKASRITLKVTHRKFESLQNITTQDCQAEGADCITNIHNGQASYRYGFYQLWESINKKPGVRWEDNPEVVAISFAPIFKNVEELTS